jgi:hypothetical protein
MTSHRVWRSFLALLYDFWVVEACETDSTKIVSYTAGAAGVCVARVAYEDIRQAFGLPGVSNELLRARANARVTNKKALSKIATSLLEAGQAKRIYDYLVVDISRGDLATRKKDRRPFKLQTVLSPRRTSVGRCKTGVSQVATGVVLGEPGFA